MNQHLHIITHTAGNRPGMLDNCIKSVKPQLRDDITHHVIECSNHDLWVKERLSMHNMGEYIAIVDDDDVIMPSALTVCWDIMKQTNVGVVFTNQQVVDASEKVLHSPRVQRRTYEQVVESPTTIHHLAIVNTNYVDYDRCVDMAQKYGTGIEWFCRASAALRGGAIHVPMVGYSRMIHGDNDSHRYRSAFASRFEQMQADIQPWCSAYVGLIPLSTDVLK